MKSLQRGFTLLELLSALAIGAMMMVGVATLIDTSLDDTKAQQAGQYQEQVTTAASKYIADNYLALVALAEPARPATVTLDALRTGGYLAANFPNINSYGQTPCVLVLEPAANRLDALVVTEVGEPIPQRILPYAAANSGKGGGYIELSGGSLVGRGAFGTGVVSAANLGQFLGASCSGTAATAGHLASAIFFDGPGNVNTDYLYRNSVPGHPELNRMRTPLQIRMAADVVEGSSNDALCISTDNTTWGRFVVNSNGVILSCQAGTWKRPPNLYWRDPVTSFSALPTTDNMIGDVRVATDKGRAFTWNGSAWAALAVDENGVLKTDFVQLEKTVIRGEPCNPDGLVAKNADGLVLSCQSGKWDTQSTTELGYTETSCQKIRKSVVGIEPDDTVCPAVFPQGAIVYNPAYDTYYATISREVSTTKNGLISVSSWSIFSRGIVNDEENATGQSDLKVTIKDKATGQVLASSVAKTPALTNSAMGINVPLSKAVPKGTYIVEVMTAYSLFDGASKTFNRSNFRLFNGSILEETPLMTGWTIDVYY